MVRLTVSNIKTVMAVFLRKKLCINNCGHITNFGRTTMLEDLVELTNELVKFDGKYLI